MNKLPALKAQKVANALKRGRRTLISFHPKPLSRNELKTILKQTKLTEEEFLTFL